MIIIDNLYHAFVFYWIISSGKLGYIWKKLFDNGVSRYKWFSKWNFNNIDYFRSHVVTPIGSNGQELNLVCNA